MRLIPLGTGLRASPNLGIVNHGALGDVIVWRQHEFHAWWNGFEQMFEHPLSRMFVNAILDSLEFKQILKPPRGMFGKKRFNSELTQLCSSLGWGKVAIDERSVAHGVHPLLSVAFCQYVVETYDQQRYKVRWTEPYPQAVQLEMEETASVPSPKPSNHFPWSRNKENINFNTPSIEIEQHSHFDLRLEGERVLIVPIDAFDRFFSSCLPYTPNSHQDWFNYDGKHDATISNLLATIVKSIATMFLQSEQPVYIIDEASWEAYIHHYLVERGWGKASEIDYDESTCELNASFVADKNLPFTLGMLCGIWERAHGRTCRVELQQKNGIFFVKIQSLLHYQNN